MLYLPTVPILIFLLGAGLFGLLLWMFVRAKHDSPAEVWGEARSDPLMWLLVLAAFTTGVFLAYVLFAGPAGVG